MLMRGDIVTLGTAVGTVTGILGAGQVIVAWRFGNTKIHNIGELVPPSIWDDSNFETWKNLPDV